MDQAQAPRVKQVIGVGDMKVSNNVADTLITYALGSCLGVVAYDPVAKVGGLLHVMLPISTIDPAKAAKNPCMFVDTGVPKLFHECYQAGAQKGRMVVKVAGGAATQGAWEGDIFEIGKRNITMLRKLLWANGVLLKAQDVGGTEPRTMSLDVATGEVVLHVTGAQKVL